MENRPFKKTGTTIIRTFEDSFRHGRSKAKRIKVSGTHFFRRHRGAFREECVVIQTQCSQCKKRYKVPEKHAGKRIRCPQCSGTIQIPQAAQASPPIPPAAQAPPPLGGLADFLESELTSGPAVADPRPREASSPFQPSAGAAMPARPAFTPGGPGLRAGSSSSRQKTQGILTGGLKKVLYIAGGVLLGLILLLVVGSSNSSVAASIFWGLFLLGILTCIAAGLWQLVIIFSESPLLGLLCFVPFIGFFVSIYCLIAFWYRMKYPFFLYLSGIAIMVFSGFFAGVTHAGINNRNSVNTFSSRNMPGSCATPLSKSPSHFPIAKDL
ncbi:MAG: hypothetical protein JXB10_11505 [Pirellulales bacterium]|nr:hypothetical protein [Pirellulales bacterium]